MTQTLRKQTTIGLSWTVIFNALKQVTQFLYFSILARLLSPDDFGLLSMVTVFIGFASMFGELGFTAALIQRQEIDEKHLSSAFWLNIFSSIAIGILVCSLAPLIAYTYNKPSLQLLTITLAINFPILAFSVVHKALLSREMDFKMLGFLNLTTFTLAGVISVGMAWYGYGVFSLVAQTIFNNIFFALTLWWVTGWYPRFIFDKEAIYDLFGFSASLLGFNTFNYWARNADNFLVGKFIGSYELGLYGQAYRIMLLPISQISSVLGGVLFPVLSKVQDKPEEAKKIYLTSLNFIAFISFPLMIGLAVVASDFIEVTYGPKWLPMTRVLQILALTGFFQSIITTVGWIYQSKGRTDIMFKWGIFSGVLVLLSFVIGIYLGSIESLAWCYLAVTLILLYWNFSIPGSLINLSFYEIISNLKDILFCTLIMAIGVFFLGRLVDDRLNVIFQLVIEILGGVLLYGLSVSLIRPIAYVKIKIMIDNYFKPSVV